MQKKVDFHMHSRTGSDGALYIQELAYLLHDLGVEYAALTDHDSTIGVEAITNFLSQIKSKLKIFSGLEITTHYKQKTLHLLAYGINPNNSELADFLGRQKDARRERAIQIVERLNRMLKNERLSMVPLESILALEGEGPITRPDIANYLLQNAYVQTFQEAFVRWLVECDVQLKSMDVFDTTRFVHALGGTPVIAHAFAPWISLNTVTRDTSEQIRLVMELKSNGLQGLEIYYQGHEVDGEGKGLPQNIELADSLGLVVTGGSDFHGGGKGAATLPGITMPKRRVDRFLELLHR